ncbi:T9SS type A sorting domain-containing protein [Polaribacter cellanae]|uniref:T9SS type A sorting domain-containing protein n=1 Tax=Polaribacter cellanae TaxID=2818493 RepID=A0A975CQ82_9FLAO|nr:T9SS type A sorting domain-containing protein [Polaribacter cellanae]QTE23335.1 T9SS type A sorting domain-containing protein [Polaribacter cellanae]
MKTKLLYLTIIYSITFSIHSQNLLNNSSWTVGSGSVTGFIQNGATIENSRELGKNHIGKDVVLWKATPDAANNADGGWNTSWINASSTNSYRFSVWIKKTNSNNGSTYFGFYANNSGSLRLNGTYYHNLYFWYGDLPKLNRWYLLVGYVHKSSYTGTTNTGGIYDGTTGEKVKTITDYKVSNKVTALRHRSYLYYDTNTLDKQYFYEPRIDVINGNEPTIKKLLKINENSKLILSYDVAGNQTQNFYCGDPSYCSPPAARKQQKTKELITHEEEIVEETDDTEPDYNNELTVYPNPTENRVSIQVEQELLTQIHTIRIYNTNSTLLQDLSFNKANKIEVDLTNTPSGVYFLHLHLKGGKSMTKKIIKK